MLASQAQKGNKSAIGRVFNPKSGNSSVNQSMKNTPENKSRKNSINSIVMNKENTKQGNQEVKNLDATNSYKSIR